MWESNNQNSWELYRCFFFNVIKDYASSGLSPKKGLAPFQKPFLYERLEGDL